MRRVLKRTTKFITAVLLAVTIFVFGSGGGDTNAVALEYEFYSTPSATTGIPSIALGPDGNIWFVKPYQDKIGKVTPDGVITEYDVNASDQPLVIAAGPDGNMWFTTYSKKVGKSTTSGSITYYDVSDDLGANYAPWGIAAGPDGNMWVNSPPTAGSGASDGRILKVTPSGSVVTYTSPGGSRGIVAGSDGNIWFAMGGISNTTSYIGRITPAGDVIAFPLPDLGMGVSDITLGPDGNIWYVRIIDTNTGVGKIGKVTPTGIATEYTTGTQIRPQTSLTTGPNGNVWFTGTSSNVLGEIDVNGNVTTYELPANTLPLGIVTGSDGDIWFSNYLTIGKITNTPEADPEDPINNVTPTALRSGKIIGAAIASVALLAIVILAALEIKKSHLNKAASDK